MWGMFELDPGWFLNPYPWLEAMRRDSPITRDDGSGLWSVFRYADVDRTLSDHGRFGAGSTNHNGYGWTAAPIASSVLAVDPPAHTRLRAMIAGPFAAHAIADLEPRIRAVAATLFDPVTRHGSMDVISDIAGPLPVAVLAEIFAIPSADRVRFRAWCGALVGLPDPFAPGKPPDEALEQDVARYFLHLIAERRLRPGPDLVSTILQAEVDGDRLTDREILGTCLLLLVMGSQATTNLIGNAVLCFLEFPEATARLVSEPEELPVALEEVLRFRSPVRTVLRVAKENLSISGQSIPKGDGILAWIASANRDEDRFDDPARFIADRSPNPHLAFGGGVHESLGAPLARLEARIALEALLARCARFRRRPSHEPMEPLASLVLQGVHHLPIVFEPEAA